MSRLLRMTPSQINYRKKIAVLTLLTFIALC